MPEPPDDPRQTADLVPDQQSPMPETVGAGTGVESTGTTAPYLRPLPAAAPTLPGYRIREEIARGGMGRVYAGYDLTLDREIAIKTLLPGANAERFVTEAKITARLPHPGIPPVHALGTLADGTPWLAMKLIHGRTLAELLKQRPSPQHESSRYVQVFEQIAQAVGFAHSRGIIHRDLKPANVMVGEFGEVQVMDWGLAKDLSSPGRDDSSRDREGAGELDDNVHHTAAGAIMGTPGYMAPEQARGELVDARADVFALGSILAAILTGKPAFVGHTSHETIEKAAAADLADVQERLANCGADAELVSLARRCLAANAAERFADGREVASEVAAYRAAVEARLRQTELEQQRALVREAEQRKRRRVVQVGAGIIAAVLLAGIIGTGWGLIAANQARDAEKRRADTEAAAKQDADAQRDQARQERDAKDAALKAEEQAKLQAEARRQEAERNLAFAKKGNELLGSVFTGLDPKANYATVSELRDALKANLEKAVRELEGTAIGEPLEVAQMQNTLGLSLLGLGEPKLAITVFEKALATRQAQLGPDHPDTLTSMHNLAAGYRDAGQLDKALPLYEETLKLTKAKLGPDHPNTLASMNNLAGGYQAAGQLDKALLLYEETLKLMKAKLGPDHPITLASMNNLAGGYLAAGQLDKALSLYEETLKLRKAKLGSDHPDTLTSMNNLAAGYRAAGQLNKALPLFEETLKLMKAKLGPDHPDTLTSMNNLAGGYRAAGQLDKALPLLEETLKLTKAKLGPDHPDTLLSMNNLAVGYRVAGQLDRALPLYEETLKLTRAKLGPDHPDTLCSMNNLAQGYQAAGQLGKALSLLEETLKLFKAKLGPDHPDTLTSMNNLAVGYRAAGRLDKALPLLEETLKLTKAKLGPDHPITLASMNNLAQGYQAAGQLGKALPLFEETLKLMKAKLGPDHPSTLLSMNNLAEGYRVAGQLDKALPLFEETLKLTRAKLGPDHPSTLLSMNNLAVGYQAAGQLDRALPLYEETLKLTKAKLGPDHPDTLTSMNNLAVGYRVAGQLDKALPLYEETLKLMKAKLGPDHPDTLASMGNLGKAYCEAKQGDKAAPLLKEFVAGQRKRFPKDDPRFAGLLAQVSLELLKCDQFSTAEEMLRECLAVREKKEPEAWTTFNTMSMLGVALVGRAGSVRDGAEKARLLADAEPLLLKGYEGMKEREKTIPPQGKPRLTEALERLIELYTAWEKPDEVKKWQAEKDKLPQPPEKGSRSP